MIPILPIKLPAPVRAIHQIELTSICDLRCAYCTSPTLKRPKLHMEWSTFEKSIKHVVYHEKHDAQRELNLAGIGESTLHPRFIEAMQYARASFSGRILLATNGITVSGAQGEEIVKVAAKNRITFWVSLHRPEKAGLAVELCKRYGILGGVSMDPSVNADDWAGQVKWFRSYQNEMPCQWIRDQKAMVMADGRVTTCCLDASGAGVLGTIEENPGTLVTKPYSLCRGCQQVVGVVGYEQRA